ncbi:unnamed protein product [Parnassius apollo]|uniref:(apollo) hypothetical protein n=1 Tax=Parnassius apollo TaxID=110799 RepID=A0A8S3XGV3_PARAO|nr:unnamed protein product [Parnassius apollo]
MNRKNLKKQVCRKLLFEMIEPLNDAPDEMLISASTSPVASTSKALTVFEEIEKVYSEGPVNIDYAHVEIPDQWSGSETSENDDVGDIRTKKKKNPKSKQKKKVVVIIQEEPIVGEEGFRKEKKNSKKERQQKRFKGEEYVRKDGKTVNAKCLQPNPCSGKKCGNNCENISDERRQQVFDHFWKLTVDRRRNWLVNLTQKLAVKRKGTNSDTRVNTFKYHINEGEGRRVVCLQFLAATLDISAKSIYHTVKNSEWGCAKEDLRGKCIPPNKTKPDTIENVVKFIKSLPAVPSHYCRHDSSRVYLPQEFKNIPNVYSIYKKRLEGDGVDFVSEKIKYTMAQSGNASVIEIQSKTRVPLMSCYRSCLPISKLKYDDLAKLCKDKVIPGHFQHEYLNIPHSQTEKDRLPESDIEDLEV